MIFVVVSLLLIAGWTGLIRKYQRPDNRNVIVGVFRDKRAIIVGAAWVLFVLVMGFASDRFHGLLINMPAALIGGFAVAAILNWFNARRGASSS